MRFDLKKNYSFVCFLALFCMGFFVSCGSGNKEKDTTNETVDADKNVVADVEVDVDASIPDEDVSEDKDASDADTVVPVTDVDSVVDADTWPTHEELAGYDYPEVTSSSKKKGLVAQNIYFFDEENREHNLAMYYKKSELIWLIFSTYDCPYCNVEKTYLSGFNTEDFNKRGLKIILIMNGYLNGPKPGDEPERLKYFKEKMIKDYGPQAEFIYAYLKSDQQPVFQKFINNGYPVNIFLDGDDMKILRHEEGFSETQKYADIIDYYLESY